MSESWGAPTWIFFHTICEKIKQDNNNVFKELISYIYTICHSLPCPLCTSHAAEYLKNNNINNIKNKEELRTFLFKFHNNVNEKKQKPIYKYENLEKYKNESFIQVYNTFYNRFYISSSGMQINKIYMNKFMLARLHKWLLQNQHYFDM